MIIYREKPYPIQMRNVMLLEPDDSSYVLYVSKETYDQALQINVRFDGNINRVYDMLSSNIQTELNKNQGLVNVIKRYSIVMPSPINMLVPFLTLCYKKDTITWDVDSKDISKQIIGILHTYSQFIDFSSVISVPPEVRLSIDLPVPILMNYENSWSTLCDSLEESIEKIWTPKDFGVQPTIQQPVYVQQVQQPIQPVSSVQPSVSQVQPTQQTQANNVEASAESANVYVSPSGKKLDLDKTASIFANLSAKFANGDDLKPTPKVEEKPIVKENKQTSASSTTESLLEEYMDGGEVI